MAAKNHYLANVADWAEVIRQKSGEGDPEQRAIYLGSGSFLLPSGASPDRSPEEDREDRLYLSALRKAAKGAGGTIEVRNDEWNPPGVYFWRDRGKGSE